MRSQLYCLFTLLIIAGVFSGCRTEQLEGDTVRTPMAVPEESSHTGSAAQTAKQQAETESASASATYQEAVTPTSSNASNSTNGGFYESGVNVQAAPSVPEDATVLTEADNGGSTAVDANTTVIVQLPGNPTTGYTWSVKSYDTSILSLEVHDYTADTSDRMGSGGTFSFQFKALAPGSSTITLTYERPWEKDVPPAKTFSTEVDVQ